MSIQSTWQIVLAVVVILGITAGSLVRSGQRQISPLENIDGIPYPDTPAGRLVTEVLAHADVYLTEPVLAKRLRLTITFVPHALQQLAVGVRSDSFWLSYDKQTIYQSAPDHGQPDQPHTVTVTIPLTDKFQDTDRSLDLMFFADSAGASAAAVDLGADDSTLWTLKTIEADVALMRPTWPEVKNYVRSLVYRERAL